MEHFWVVGTDTDVGKTFITTLFMRHLQMQGLKVIPYKPVQTGEVADEGRYYYQDTTSYLEYSLQPLDKEALNTYSFSLPASPHYAAELEGETIKEDRLLNTIEKLKLDYDTVICEGAGGLYVPFHSNTTLTLLDVIEQSALPVILVAKTKLGTINHTLLSVKALQARNIDLLGIVFNQFEQSPLEKNSIDTILRFIDVPSVVIEANCTIESFDDKAVFERLMTYDI
ncbi:dethiobiotin synthase [Psychrobacillus vulpis]|uniref:ATP-dependent dethiobiotin synthetase BioD n=1 Tax=Psychrobacillus vulpis TaxID=2325572 RepID=A0A544TSV5_9BACI|nr:dethiobiotin synthase [Psychrobacillus vulpis]TQR20515.1 dethiobiotin synthase [Psychrobacillus vulpis]